MRRRHLDDEMRKLEVRLGHWINHNREHGGEFREAAGRAREVGQASVERHLLQASHHMDEATDSLHEALMELKK